LPASPSCCGRPTPACPERLATPFPPPPPPPWTYRWRSTSAPPAYACCCPAWPPACAPAPRDKTIADNLREATALGAQLFACSDALHAQGIEAAQLMPGVQRGGAVQFMARAIDRDWRVLVF
jgi:hypothetical protein